MVLSLLSSDIREIAGRVEAVLGEIDLAAVAASYEAGGEDPSIYFYPDFLRAYDPPAARNRASSSRMTGASRVSCQ